VKILTLAGIGVLAAMAFMYLAPKVKQSQQSLPKKIVTKPVLAGPVYPPVHVNLPNNATQPIQKDYLALMGRRYY
jgi:hypothetical protein